MVTNETLPLAREAAIRIRDNYQTGELRSALAEVGVCLRDCLEASAKAEHAVIIAERAIREADEAIKDREADLLAVVDGSNETQRKANFAQAKKADDTLVQLRANLKVLKADLAEKESAAVEAKAARDARKLELQRLSALVEITAAELNAIGAVA